MRAAQLRKQPLCERHLSIRKIIPATVAHHKVPHRGDPQLFWYGQLASVCKVCHDEYEQRVESVGYDIELDAATGLPSDPNHPFNR